MFGQAESVGLKEGFGQKPSGDLEAHVLEIGGGSEAALAELVDVEGELGPDVSVRVLSVVDVGPVSFFELGELYRDGEVDGRAVADGVADVV